MRVEIISKLILVYQMVLLGCQSPSQTKENERMTAALIEQVKEQVEAFHAADTALSSDGVIDLLWPEYLFYFCYRSSRNRTVIGSHTCHSYTQRVNVQIHNCFVFSF